MTTSPLVLPGNLTIFGEPQVNALEQMKVAMQHPAVTAAALMADNHLGMAVPIGGVLQLEDAISVAGVGVDIGCGNKAVLTNVTYDEIKDNLKPIMREIQKKIEFGMGRSNGEMVDDPVMDNSSTWTEIEKVFGNGLRQKAARQLGTVGGGNHYVDLLVGDKGSIWVACHFGSRGLGHTIAKGFTNQYFGRDWNDPKDEKSDDPIIIPTTNDFGEFYIAAMHLAGKYAYAGRDYVVDTVLNILGAHPMLTVHNHHNFAWKEDGQWRVRKGATPLTRDMAFIGGSMGDISVIVREKLDLYNFDQERMEYPTVPQIGNLGSAPHGAGRVMSRNQAAGKVRKMWTCNNRDCDWQERAQQGNTRAIVVDGEVIPIEHCPKCGNKKLSKARMRDTRDAAIDWDASRKDLTERGIVVLGAGADEAPGVYKDLATVLAAHPNIEIIETLYPVGVVMAGPDEFDPYRD